MPKRPKLTLPAPETPYEVGYRKPPVAQRFVKGSSGNPKGRPRRAKNKMPALNEERLKTIILAEAYRTIRVTDNGKPVTISIAQAVIRSIALGAAKGHQRSQRLFADMLAKTEAANKKLNDEWFNTAIDYKLAWERELERRARLGVDGPAPLPHPDDLVLDMQTGLVRVKGPFTKEEKEKWDFLRARKIELKEIIAENEQALRDDPDSELADEYRNEIRQDQELLDKICTVIKD